MSNLQALIGYQATDKTLLDIEKALAATEERKKYMQARKFMKNAQATLETYENKAVALTGELSRLEEQYNGVAAELKEFSEIDFQELENSEGGTAFFKKNALALSDTLRSLKRDLASVREKMEAVTKDYLDLKKKTLVMQKQFKEYKEKYALVEQGKAGEVQEIRSRLAGMEKDIPADVLERYKTRRKEGLWPVLVPLKGDRCGFCSMELPRAAISKLNEKGAIECENCHRLIYKE